MYHAKIPNKCSTIFHLVPHLLAFNFVTPSLGVKNFLILTPNKIRNKRETGECFSLYPSTNAQFPALRILLQFSLRSL
jgi:hypothetical protein